MRQWLRRLLGRESGPDCRVGVYFAADYVAVAAVTPDGRALQHCDCREASADQQQERLAELVRTYGLERAPATVVLDAGSYQNQQLELPGVPEAELAEAAKLRIRSLIRQELEQVYVAALRLYSDRKADGGAMVMAVAADRARVDRLVEMTEAAGLSVAGVLPQEAALNGLVAYTPDPAVGVALLLIGDSGGIVTISRGQQLYLARSHSYSAARVAQQGELSYEGVVLELQRSLDYYESQLASSAVAQLLVLPTAADRSPLLDHLNEAVATPAAGLDLLHLFECEAEQPPGDVAQARCLLAVAGALPEASAQTASLYTPPSRKIDPLGAGALTAYMSAFVAVLGIAAAFTAWSAAQREAELAARQEQREALTAQVERLEQKVSRHEPSRRLLRRQRSLEAQIELRRSFLRELTALAGRYPQGFVPVLEALARQRLERLWLTGLRLDHSAGLVLRGRALEPDAVPRLLDGLAETSAFSDSDFRGFSLRREAADEEAARSGEVERAGGPQERPQGLRFRISTEASASDSGGGS